MTTTLRYFRTDAKPPLRYDETVRPELGRAERALPLRTRELDPLPVLRLTPPYRGRRTALRVPWVEPPAPEPGTVHLISVSGPSSDWDALSVWVPRLRRLYPTVPVGLVLEGPPDVEALHLARRSVGLSVRALLSEDEPADRALRRALSDPVDLAGDVVEWLGVRGTVPTAKTGVIIREMFRQSSVREQLGPFVASLGQHVRTVRDWFLEAGLPSPHEWLAAATSLRAALHLQREPETPLLNVAWEHGYSDHSALSRQLWRLFDVRSNQIRRCLGWEWLLDRWLRSAGFPAGGAPLSD